MDELFQGGEVTAGCGIIVSRAFVARWLLPESGVKK